MTPAQQCSSGRAKDLLKGTTRVRKTASRRGIALIMVLWIVAVISILGLTFSFSSRTEVLASTAYGDRVRNRFAAEAGVRHAIVEILHAKANGEDAWALDGSPTSGRLAYGAYQVSITPEESRIDINRSSPELLHGLFVSLGLSAADADALVDAIQDWRDPDDLVRNEGAEASYYESLDPPYTPRNAHFDSTNELLLVRGVTRNLWDGDGARPGLKDLVTVYSPSGKIDPGSASPAVLSALEGMTEASIEEIIDLRADEGLPSGFALARTRELSPGAAPFLAAPSGRVYRIRSTGLRGTTPHPVGVEAVVSYQGNRADVLFWNGRARGNGPGPREGNVPDDDGDS